MAQVIVGGLTAGAIYALLALGLVTVFRSSSFLNLAQGEFYVWGALLATTLVARGWPVAAAMVVAATVIAAFAAGLYWIVFRRAGGAPHAMQLLVSLGVALAMSGAAKLLWGTDDRSLPPVFGDRNFEILGAAVSAQVLVVWATLVLLCLLLVWLLYRTMFGKAMAAVASSPAGAGLLGVNITSVGAASFAIAGTLGAIAGVVVTPQVFVSYHSGLLLTVLGFIAAATGGMVSIPGAVAGGIGLGLVEAFVAYYIDSALKTPIAFTALVAILLYRAGPGRSLRTMGTGERRRSRSSPPALPANGTVRRSPLTMVGQGRAGLGALAVVLTFAVLGGWLLPPYWLSVWTFIGVFVLVGLGLDLLLGYTGQLSLGQTAFVGLAAYLVALSGRWWGLQGWAPVAIAVAGTAAVSALLGAIVLRLRGYYFALATLAVSMAAEALANGLPNVLGGPSGLPVKGELAIGGFDLSTPGRLFVATWLLVVAGLIIGGRLVRSRFGQAMVAVGSDETAAAASGIHPFPIRLKVFVLSASYAGVAGVVLAHALRFITPPALGFHGGVDAIVGLLLGGFGTLWGPVVGIPVVRLLAEAGGRFAEVQQLVYGLTIVAMVMIAPDGIVGAVARLIRRGPTHAIAPERSSEHRWATPDRARSAAGTPAASEPALLRAESLSKTFGGLRAVDGVDLAVARGGVLGVIGPNGAGKTTCLGLLAGSLAVDQGRVVLDGRDVTRLPAAARASLGLARTFQLPRLVGDLDVLDTVALGAYRRGRSGLVAGAARDIGWRERAGLRAAAADALDLVGIMHLSDVPARQLSTGQQKMLELARAVASKPIVLLADEPAGGLFEDEVGELGQVLRRLAAEGIGVVLVEHEMRLVMSVCDEVVVLGEGRVIAAGTPSEVRRSEVVIDAYLGT